MTADKDAGLEALAEACEDVALMVDKHRRGMEVAFNGSAAPRLRQAATALRAAQQETRQDAGVGEPCEGCGGTGKMAINPCKMPRGFMAFVGGGLRDEDGVQRIVCPLCRPYRAPGSPPAATVQPVGWHQRWVALCKVAAECALLDEGARKWGQETLDAMADIEADIDVPPPSSGDAP